jgi:hypothetical protein
VFFPYGRWFVKLETLARLLGALNVEPLPHPLRGVVEGTFHPGQAGGAGVEVLAAGEGGELAGARREVAGTAPHHISVTTSCAKARR